jgi:ATP-dependent RNA helicase SUPV3L1/SUV3
MMIEVWRPGRIGERRRVKARQAGRAKQVGGQGSRASYKPSPEPPAADTDAVLANQQADAATTASTIQAEAHAKPRHRVRQRPPEHRMKRQEERQHRQKRERQPGKYFEPREKRPDPNSPFAKLAALKAQLEADAKERR